MSKKSIAAALAAIGVSSKDSTLLQGCSTVDDEFLRLKKSYFKLVLASHPDKGGDPEVFRATQEAWEVLRSLYDGGKVNPAGFSHYLGKGADEMATAAASDGRPPPSWEWYAEAADEPVPGYKVEAAKSDRSKCVATGNKKTPAKHGDDAEIAKGELRCGHLDPEAGSYGRWHHLACWRVPASIWLGLPGAKVKDPAAFEAALLAMSQLALCGFAELSPELRAQFVAHVMNRKNHARLTKNSKARVPLDEQGGHGCGEYEEGGAGPAGPAAAGAAKAEPSTALVPSAAPASGGLFVAPRPGVNGALAGSLGGQTFVLTGLFPELGGGAGLDLGKARCKALIESFGGRVTGSVSGKTSYLVVGKAPGASKVSQAVAKGVPTVDLAGLKAVLEGGPGASLADAPPAHIGEFSTGYHGNGIGRLITYDQRPNVPLLKAAKKPAAKKGRGGGKRKRAAADDDDDDE